jgi:hypothetical protein
MKLFAIGFVILLPLAAQEIKLPPSFDRLAEKASEVVDVTLDSSMLQMASRFLSDKDADEVKAKKLVSGLKGIYVKSFEFDKAGEYDMADVEALRAQVRGPAWSRIVGVRSKKNGENAEVYLKNEGGQVTGLLIIAAEPKELTVVTINGSIDPAQLRDLGGHFGVPKMDVGSAKKSGTPSPDKED